MFHFRDISKKKSVSGYRSRRKRSTVRIEWKYAMDRIQIAISTLLIEYGLWILIKSRKSAVDTTNVSSSLVPGARDSVIRACEIKIFDVEQKDEILFLHQRRSGQRFKGWYPRNLFTFSFFSFRHLVLNHTDVGVSSSVCSRVFSFYSILRLLIHQKLIVERWYWEQWGHSNVHCIVSHGITQQLLYVQLKNVIVKWHRSKQRILYES